MSVNEYFALQNEGGGEFTVNSVAYSISLKNNMYIYKRDGEIIDLYDGQGNKLSMVLDFDLYYVSGNNDIRIFFDTDYPSTIYNLFLYYEDDSFMIVTIRINEIGPPVHIDPEGIFNITAQITSPTCFNMGTKILVKNNDLCDEYIAIELLKKGMLVKTYKHGYKAIVNIGKNVFFNNPDVFSDCMYVMKSNDDKFEDLYVTGWHAILVDEMTDDEKKKQRVYVNDRIIEDKVLLLAAVSDKFQKLNNNNMYTYYHIVLENDDEHGKYGIWANGVLTETLTLSDYNKKKLLDI